MNFPDMVGFDPDYEKFECDLLARILKAGTGAIDIGAHTGHYSLLAGRYLSSTGKVLAIEPSPFNFPRLVQNIWANGFRHVVPLCCAVGRNSIEKIYFDGGSGGDDRLDLRPGEDRTSVSVVSLSLDVIAANTPFATNIQFVKIDVQGRETAVIEGGRKFFADNPDMVMLVEYSPLDLRMAGSSGDALLSAIRSIGCIVAITTSLKTGEKHWGTLGPDDKLWDGPEDENNIANLLCLRGKYQEIIG